MHVGVHSANRQPEGTKRASQFAPGNAGNFSDTFVRQATYISGSVYSNCRRPEKDQAESRRVFGFMLANVIVNCA